MGTLFAHIVKTLKKHPNSTTVSLSQVSLSNTFKQQSFNLQLQYLLDFNIFKIFKMQFSYALIAAAACAVANAVIITNGPASFVGIQAGRALNITWADAEGPVTLTLKTGEANALTTVSTIASGLSGTSYAWAIPSTLPESFYALQIDDSSDVPNYSAASRSPEVQLLPRAVLPDLPHLLDLLPPHLPPPARTPQSPPPALHPPELEAPPPVELPQEPLLPPAPLDPALPAHHPTPTLAPASHPHWHSSSWPSQP